jgi:hypothetical protein
VSRSGWGWSAGQVAGWSAGQVGVGQVGQQAGW